ASVSSTAPPATLARAPTPWVSVLASSSPRPCGASAGAGQGVSWLARMAVMVTGSGAGLSGDCSSGVEQRLQRRPDVVEDARLHRRHGMYVVVLERLALQCERFQQERQQRHALLPGQLPVHGLEGLG